MAAEPSVTVIGRSATFNGELSSEYDVQIDGNLEGTVRVPSGRITVGPDAKVNATLDAQDIIVHGRVEGELRTTGRAELRASSTVVGDVYAARLSVEADATVHGRVECRQGEARPSAPASARTVAGDESERAQQAKGAGGALRTSSGLMAAAERSASAQPSGSTATSDATNQAQPQKAAAPTQS